jgi:hypothetical protein
MSFVAGALELVIPFAGQLLAFVANEFAEAVRNVDVSPRVILLYIGLPTVAAAIAVVFGAGKF